MWYVDKPKVKVKTVKLKSLKYMTLITNFSKNIKSTVARFGTMIFCDNARQNVCGTVTFINGQGKKKVFSETSHHNLIQ